MGHTAGEQTGGTAIVLSHKARTSPFTHLQTHAADDANGVLCEGVLCEGALCEGALCESALCVGVLWEGVLAREAAALDRALPSLYPSAIELSAEPRAALCAGVMLLHPASDIPKTRIRAA